MSNLVSNFCHKSEHSSKSPWLNNEKAISKYVNALDDNSIISVTDHQGHITYVNEAFCALAGYELNELLGKKHSITRHPETPDIVYQSLWKTISKGESWHGIIKNVSKNKHEFIVSCAIIPIFNDDGDISEFLSIRHDITQIYNQVHSKGDEYFDNVTKLPNSKKFTADCQEMDGAHIAVFTIPDLEQVHYAYTIEFYDILVRQVLEYIAKQFPSDYKIYRCSDNLFTVVTPPHASFDDLQGRAHYLRYVFPQHDFCVDSISFNLSISLGLAKFNKTDNTFINAKLALRQAKALQQDICVYKQEDKLYQLLVNDISWNQKIRTALDNDQIHIYGQDIVNAKGDVTSTEVLVRLYDEQEHKTVSPFFFLDVAKKHNLYHAISQQVMIKAIRHFKAQNQTFSINLSSEDIANISSRKLLIQLISEYHIGHLLTIELVESEMCNPENKDFMSFIETLQALGCRIAIDDFGSGYSNFNYLFSLPIDVLKIDGSLIRGIESNKKHQILIASVIALCRKLNIQVVAEYIEDEITFKILKKLGADYFQGYKFSKPYLLSK